MCLRLKLVFRRLWVAWNLRFLRGITILVRSAPFAWSFRARRRVQIYSPIRAEARVRYRPWLSFKESIKR